MNIQEFLQFAERYKNWGRWGAEDEAGTLNFVTPEDVANACRLGRRGRVFSLAIPFDQNGPQRSGARRFNPVHSMLRTGFDWPGMGTDNPPIWGGTDDMVTMPLQCATQWDSLAHVIFRGKMYNNRPYSLVDGQGAHKNSITAAKDRVIGRGVLLDIPRHRGVPWLEPGQSVNGDELEACARRQGVEVRRGDFLLVRTGHIGLCRHKGSFDDFISGPWPGLGLSAVPWLFEKQIASVAADNVAVEADPSEVDGQRLPLHLTCIANMGLLLGEMFDLDPLAQDCDQDGVYEFLFMAPPLPITRAVGSPINPYAVK